MEPSQSQTAKPKVTSFFPLQKLKGTQPSVETPAVCLAHLEEENTEEDEEVHNEDPDGIEGVMEEFMVYLTRAVKDTQKEEKCCHLCSSLNHCIHDCPLVKTSRTDSNLNCKEGTVPKKGAFGPSDESDHTNNAPRGSTQGVKQCTQTTFLNPDPSQ